MRCTTSQSASQGMLNTLPHFGGRVIVDENLGNNLPYLCTGQPV